MQWHKYDLESVGIDGIMNFANGRPAEYHDSDDGKYLFIIDGAGLHLHLNLFDITLSFFHPFNMNYDALPLAKHICLLYSKVLDTNINHQVQKDWQMYKPVIIQKLKEQTTQKITQELTKTGWRN